MAWPVPGVLAQPCETDIHATSLRREVPEATGPPVRDAVVTARAWLHRLLRRNGTFGLGVPGAPAGQVAQRRVLTDSALPAWIGSVLTVFPKPFAIRVIRMLRSSMAI